MKLGTHKGFTLVELIVVITILAILGTVAFLSLQGYSKSARDSRRISDINNIKTSLELFSLNTGYYPTPDDGKTVSYLGDILWTQGFIGDNVTINLSKNLQKKPLDPLFEFEYIYSLTYSKKEYEVLSIYEGELASNNLINNTYAANNYVTKIEGTYNQIFVKSKTFIVPIPSIITSETLPMSIENGNNVNSLIITNGDNFPALNIPNTEKIVGGLDMILTSTGFINSDSSDAEKTSVITIIQNAYSGSIKLASKAIYTNILNTSEPVILAEQLFLNSSSSGGGGGGNESVTSLINVFDCSTNKEIKYGTIDGTDELLTCDNDIIICNGTTGSGYTIAACNLGSTIVGTNWTTSGGYYFQWGRNKGFEAGDSTQQPTIISGTIGLNSSTDTYGFVWGNLSALWTWANTNIDDNWGSITGTFESKKGPCPDGYYIPTLDEWTNVSLLGDGAIGGWDINGTSTEGTDMMNALKLPMAGERYRYDGNLRNNGVHGYYWTSSFYSGYAPLFYFHPTTITYDNKPRAIGKSLRCFKK